MFDFGWDEMALIGVVSLIVIGPKDLPKVLREAGRWVRRAREMAAEFQSGLEEMTRDTEVHDLKRDVEAALDTHSIRSEIEQAVKLDEPPLPAASDAAEPAVPAGELPPPNHPETAHPEIGGVEAEAVDATQHIPPSP